MPKQIVIIGAGPAGLTAAVELTRSYPDYKVLVLDENTQAGGISRTMIHSTGNRMDLGGHRLFTKDPRIEKWWTSLLPMQGSPSLDDRLLKRNARVQPGGPNPDETDKTLLIRHRISRIFYKKHFYDYPLSPSFKTFKNLGFITLLQVGFSYLYSCIHQLPETSLENFYINRFGRKLYSMFFEGYTEKLWGRHPSGIAADWGSQRVKGISIFSLIQDMLQRILGIKSKKVQTSLIDEFYYPKLGIGQMWEAAAQEIINHGGEVRYQCCVTGLKQHNGRIEAVICNGQEIPADIVFSSMPLTDLIAGLNDVPENIRHIAQGLPYRDFMTVGVLVNRLALQNNTNYPTFRNVIPDNWIYVQDSGVHVGRIEIFNNWSPYLLKDPQNTVWLGLEYFCKEGDELWNLSDQQAAEMAEKELKHIGLLADQDSILDFSVHHVKKAYPAYFDTYAQIDSLKQYVDTISNLYCIGRNGQHRYNNMDHSMLTALEAVKHLTQTPQAPRTNIWQVNTEKEYHETK